MTFNRIKVEQVRDVLEQVPTPPTGVTSPGTRCPVVIPPARSGTGLEVDHRGGRVDFESFLLMKTVISTS